MKYFIKRGCFGQHGSILISKFKAILCFIFMDYALYKEVEGEEVWIEKWKDII